MALKMMLHFMKHFPLFLRNASPSIHCFLVKDTALSMCLQIVMQYTIYEKCRRNRKEKGPLVVNHRPAVLIHHHILADHIDIGIGNRCHGFQAFGIPEYFFKILCHTEAFLSRQCLDLFDVLFQQLFCLFLLFAVQKRVEIFFHGFTHQVFQPYRARRLLPPGCRTVPLFHSPVPVCGTFP